MKKEGYPRGNPVEDGQKLMWWWKEEMQKCGLAGEVSVEYSRLDGRPPATGMGKQLFDSLVLRQSSVTNMHAYIAALPGGPWPLETAVLTTESGMVTDILYRALLKCPVASEVSFQKSIGLLSDKLEVEGPEAGRFQERKPLLKKIKDGLNRRYEPPLWGFVASKKFLELQQVSVSLRPTAAGSEAVIHTTARVESAFVGHNYSLGLDRAIDIFKALEEVS
jgi:hypothetical protein